MNNTFSLEQRSKTGDHNADLIMRQNNLDKMAKYMEIKSINPKLKQSEIAKEMKISSSTIQRNRREKICFHHIENYHRTLTQENKRLHTIQSMISNELK